MTVVSVIGAPSSAGAYAVGQEDAPAALRDAGLLRRLSDAGVEVRDEGDLPLVRWRPDREQPRVQNLAAVVETVGRVQAAVAGAAGRNDLALVLGGDCTVGIGAVAAIVAAGGAPGLVYLDMHADLNVPESVVDGALDWMGMAHMLALDGCVPELRDAGPRTPLLDPASVVVLGHEHSQATAWERDAIRRLGLACIPAERLRAGPAEAADDALDRLPEGCDRLAVHFDVDVVDFIDAPLSENTGRNIGVPLAAALVSLAAVLRDPRVAVVTVTECNPAHAAAEPAALGRLCDGLAEGIAAASR
jgi:arginase